MEVESLPNGDGLPQEQDIHGERADHGGPIQFEEEIPTAVAGQTDDSPLFVSEGSPSTSSVDFAEALNPELIDRHGLAVIVPTVVNAWEYRRYEEPPDAVEILEEYDDGGLIEYLVRFDDESEEVVCQVSFAAPKPHARFMPKYSSFPQRLRGKVLACNIGTVICYITLEVSM